MRRPVAWSIPLADYFQASPKMKACPIFAIVGTITPIVQLCSRKGDVLYRYIDTSEVGGKVRCLERARE